MPDRDDRHVVINIAADTVAIGAKIDAVGKKVDEASYAIAQSLSAQGVLIGHLLELVTALSAPGGVSPADLAALTEKLSASGDALKAALAAVK